MSIFRDLLAVRNSIGILGFIFCTMVSTGYAQTLTACKALANVNNQLYVVTSDGSIVSQFASDNQDKSSINFSPDGQKAVYIHDDAPDAFVLADVNGRIATFPVQKSTQGTFTEVGFDSPSILKVQYHVSPTNDIFHFLPLPNNVPAPLRPVVRPIAGIACSLKTNGITENVCISENKVIIGNMTVLDQDPITPKNATLLSSATILMGTSFTTPTSPSIRIHVMSIADGVTMQITLPDGAWSQSRVPVGSAMPVNIDGVVYGIMPIQIDNQTGQVKINILIADSAGNTLDSAVAVSPDNHIAVIMRGANGAQLSLITSNGKYRQNFDLGALDDVLSINYDSRRTLMLRTRTTFRALTFTASHSGQVMPKLSTSLNLPVSLDVHLPTGLTQASIEGWVCQ